MRCCVSHLKNIVTITFILALYACTTAESEWVTTREEGTVQAYKTYLKKYPSSSQAEQARNALDMLAWDEAEKASTAGAYEGYLKNYPKGSHSADARSRLDELGWMAAEQKGDADAYKDYLKTFPKGAHRAEADSQLDRMTYEAASQKGSITRLRDYIRASERGSLRGAYVNQAKVRLEELLKNARVPKADMKKLISRLEKLAVPYGLRDLYEEVTKDPPPPAHAGALFSSSTSSSPGSDDEVSQITHAGRKVTSIRGKRQPKTIPVVTTLTRAVLGKEIAVIHVGGTVTAVDFLGGFDDRSPDLRVVFILSSPSKSRSNGIGFEQIDLFEPKGAHQQYTWVDNRWYKSE